MTKTFVAKKGQVDQKWYVVDASQRSLGRLASRIALILQGKNKPTYTPHVDTGDFVVVLNAAQLKLTGRKMQDKIYTKYTGHIGGLRKLTAQELLAKRPEQVVRLAVRRMLPKSKLGDAMLGKLKIYPGLEHPHSAQQPEALTV